MKSSDVQTPRNPQRHFLDAARQRETLLKRMHHHAFRTEDMEATRAFYEDLLGLPMIASFVETTDGQTGAPTNYIHTFFELSDGSCLAFFQFKPQFRGPSKIGGKDPVDPFDHHIALEVEGTETVDDLHEKARRAGVQSFIVNHGYCYSLYLIDPNNMFVELTTRVAATNEIMRQMRGSAHETLRHWLVGEPIGANNEWRHE